MNEGLVFMCFGSKHNAHQVVAFHTARQHWNGPIAIITDEGNQQAMQQFADNDPLNLTDVILFKPHGRRSHGAGAGYLNKAKLIELMPYMRSVFLDCDTLCVGDFASYMMPGDSEIRLTQFSDWVTTGRKMVKRIRHWQETCPEQSALQLAHNYPAINTGVMGLSKLSKKLAKDWYQTTSKNVRFMCDELAMQMIFLKYPHVVMPDYMNCSPIYSPGRVNFDEEKVAIWHGHGFKSIRSAKGLSIWLPHLLELWRDNTYNIQEAFTKQKYFVRLSADPVKFIQAYGKEQAEELIERNDITETSFR